MSSKPVETETSTLNGAPSVTVPMPESFTAPDDDDDFVDIDDDDADVGDAQPIVHKKKNRRKPHSKRAAKNVVVVGQQVEAVVAAVAAADVGEKVVEIDVNELLVAAGVYRSSFTRCFQNF